jgi:predicted nucleic acid-binding Zn ribbon protein
MPTIRNRTDVRRQAPSTLRDVTTRYRCTACGNLTRFDVTTSRRTRAFHHYSVGGELQIEDEEVLAETTEEVSCRWCGTAKDVVELHEDDVPAASAEAAASDSPSA